MAYALKSIELDESRVCHYILAPNGTIRLEGLRATLTWQKDDTALLVSEVLRYGDGIDVIDEQEDIKIKRGEIPVGKAGEYEIHLKVTSQYGSVEEQKIKIIALSKEAFPNLDYTFSNVGGDTYVTLTGITNPEDPSTVLNGVFSISSKVEDFQFLTKAKGSGGTSVSITDMLHDRRVSVPIDNGARITSPSFNTLAEDLWSKSQIGSINVVAVESSVASYKTHDKRTFTLPEGGVWLVDVGKGSPMMAQSDDEALLGRGNMAYGYAYNDESGNTKVVLFNDYKAPVASEWNITATFEAEQSGEGITHDFIDQCTFGCLFGHGASMDRLFVAGSPSYPNYLIYTDLPYADDSNRSAVSDFSYFPYENVKMLGTDQNAICGMKAVTSDKLLVLKTKANGCNGIYFAEPVSVTAYGNGSVLKDAEGNPLTAEGYSFKGSSSGVCGVSPDSLASLNGDVLFIDSDGQFCGLDIQGITGDSQRQANTRSHYIDKRLSTDYRALSDGKHAYLISDDGAFATFYQSLDPDSRQYSWTPVSGMEGFLCLYDDGSHRFFGDRNGNVFMANPTIRHDTERYFLNEQTMDLSVGVISNGHFAVPRDVYEAVDTSYTFKPVSDVYALAGDTASERTITPLGNNAITTNDNCLIKDGGKYFLAPDSLGDFSMDDNELGVGDLVTAIIPDGSDGVQFLLLKGGIPIQIPKGVHFGIAFKLDGEYAIEKVADTSAGTFIDLKENGRDLVLTKISVEGNDTINVDAELTKAIPIEASFTTGPLMSGSANWNKIVRKVDLLNDSKKRIDLQFAVVTSKTDDFHSKETAFGGNEGEGAEFGFRFDGLSFREVNWGRNGIPQQETILKPTSKKRMFCLRFESKSAKDSALPKVQVTYSYSKLGKGRD